MLGVAEGKLLSIKVSVTLDDVDPVPISMMLGLGPVKLIPPTDPVTPNEPLIIADPVYGKVVSGAYEADTANDAVKANELDIALEEDIAKEALIAFCAQEAVPNKEPVKFPVNEPVLYELVKALNEEVVTNDPVSTIELVPGNP